MKNVEDMYPLSPLQESMLAHALSRPGSAANVQQVRCTLEGPLDLEVLQQTWQAIVDRHPALRTIFLWENLGEPLQVVRQKVPAVLERLDLGNLAAEEQAIRVEEFLRTDRLRGFDLKRQPMRLTAVRLGPERFRLVWSFHHLLLDGWSAAMILKEVFAYYDGFSRGRPPALPRPRPFRDYIAWLKGRDASATEAYWRRRFQDLRAPSPLLLPRPEGAKHSAPEIFGETRRTLPESLAAESRSFVRQHRLTLNGLFQAVWALLLGRLSGARDVVFGITVSGRPGELAGVESMMGMFINNLPVRVCPDPAQTVSGFLKDLQEELLELQHHEHSAPARIQEWSGLPAAVRLFETLVVFENYPEDEPATGAEPPAGAPRLRVRPDGDALETGYPLTLVVGPGKPMFFRLCYDRRLIADFVADRILDHAEALLRGLLAGGERPLAELALAAEPEAAPFATPVHAGPAFDLLRAIAARGGELVQRAAALAARLRAAGLRSEEPVALAFALPADEAIGALAILAAGGACLPLSGCGPDADLGRIFHEAGGARAIADEAGAARLAGLPVEVLRVEPAGEESADLGVVTLPSTALAWLEPRPDGPLVALSYGALGSFLSALAGRLSLGDGEAVQMEGAGRWEPLLALTAGAVLRLEDPTVGRRLALCEGLLGHGLASRLLATGCEVWSAPGFAEAGLLFGCERINDPAEANVLGQPLGDGVLRVLDSDLQRVPVGVVGDLYVGGRSLARGYLRRPDLTAERFLPDAWSQAAGGRLFRTEQRARLLPGGGLELLGPAEAFQVGPFSVSPVEVEAALRRHPAVAEAAVGIWESSPGDVRLTAWVVPAGEGLPASEVRRFLRTRLPELLVPRLFVEVDELWRAPGGAVDRAALPAPTAAGTRLRSAAAAPRTPAELELVRIWEDLFSLGGIGVQDDFFELGGHSLLAVRLRGRIQEAFGRQLPLATLFEHRTVEALARQLDEASGRPGGALVTIQGRGSRPPLFCVHPGGGGVLCYLDLAQGLGRDQPVYGLQDPYLEGTAEPARSIEEMAGRYLKALRPVRLAGPYRLAGWSFGGVVAFEMARQLVAEGETVSFVGLLDTWSPEAMARVFRLEDEMGLDEVIEATAGSLRQAAMAGRELPISLLDLWHTDPGSRLDLLLERAAQLLPAELGASHLRRYFDGIRLRRQAVKSYRPGDYPGEVTLLRTREPAVAIAEDLAAWLPARLLETLRREQQRIVADETYGWSSLVTGSLRLVEIPGNHHELIHPPHVHTVAGRLLDCLGSRDESQGLRGSGLTVPAPAQADNGGHEHVR